MKRIAVVGSGPSGCYFAQSILKSEPDVQIRFFDRSPEPFGLAQFGVAPDHLGTKAVTRQFARVFDKPNVEFEGGIEIGKDLSLETLREDHDVVVLACGLQADRVFEVDGSDLGNIYGAGALARHWNDHPGFVGLNPKLGATAAVLGNGNVAADMIRLMMKTKDDFAHGCYPARLEGHTVETVHVIGRSPLEQARFDASMIVELGNLPDVAFRLAETGTFSPDPAHECAAAMENLLATERPFAAKQVVFHSGWHPRKFTGEKDVEGVELVNSATGAVKTLICDSVVTAIGFENDGALDRAALVEKARDLENGELAAGLFATGWFKRGPQGKIADNRKDAQQVAKGVARWLSTN